MLARCQCLLRVPGGRQPLRDREVVAYNTAPNLSWRFVAFLRRVFHHQCDQAEASFSHDVVEAIKACAKSAAWAKALQLLSELKTMLGENWTRRATARCISGWASLGLVTEADLGNLGRV